MSDRLHGMTHPASGDTHVVVLRGDLDFYRQPEIRRTLQAAAGKARLIIDLREARYVSAAALTELIRCYKQRVANGLESARLVVRSPYIRRIFDITGLARVWTLFESLDAAACHGVGIN